MTPSPDINRVLTGHISKGGTALIKQRGKDHIITFCYGTISVDRIHVMDIERINRKHLLGLDMYYRVGYGVSSKLVKFENGILHLEVVLNKKWNGNYNAIAAELAHAWKESHDELKHAIAAKVFIIDCKTFSYKHFLIRSGTKPGYDAKKGVIFSKNYLN